MVKKRININKQRNAKMIRENGKVMEKGRGLRKREGRR